MRRNELWQNEAEEREKQVVRRIIAQDPVLRKKIKKLVLTRKIATILRELKTLKVMVIHNIGTLANNKVKDGKEAHV